MTTLYGIPNCDTIKKARKWLTDNGIEYQFHNYKKDGIDETQLRAWADEVGWKTLLNTRGMMWRKVPQDVKDTVDESVAIQLMLETPSMIKRPVLDTNNQRHVGFKEEQYVALFK